MSGKDKQAVRQGSQNVSQFHRNAATSSGLVSDLRMRLKELEDEIKADQDGKVGFENYLKELERDNFATDVAPFQQKYMSLVQDIGGIYERAKVGHAKGIDMLVKEFGYHIAYRRWDDTFTAIPFRPK